MQLLSYEMCYYIKMTKIKNRINTKKYLIFFNIRNNAKNTREYTNNVALKKLVL